MLSASLHAKEPGLDEFHYRCELINHSKLENMGNAARGKKCQKVSAPAEKSRTLHTW